MTATARAGSVAALVAVLTLAGCGGGSAELGAGEDPESAAFGDDVPVDLAILLRGGATELDLNAFLDEVLSKPEVPGRQGRAHLDGVQYVGGDDVRIAAYVDFHPGATDAEREAVVRAAEASPLVDRIERDVRPADLPAG